MAGGIAFNENGDRLASYELLVNEPVTERRGSVLFLTQRVPVLKVLTLCSRNSQMHAVTLPCMLIYVNDRKNRYKL